MNCKGCEKHLAYCWLCGEYIKNASLNFENDFNADLKCENDYVAKHDSDKLDLTLVPRQIIWDIAEIRRYGIRKYKDPDNWKKVELPRYRAAAFRHFMDYLDNPHGVDEESGIEHYKHLACNLAFICEMEKDERKND